MTKSTKAGIAILMTLLVAMVCLLPILELQPATARVLTASAIAAVPHLLAFSVPAGPPVAPPRMATWSGVVSVSTARLVDFTCTRLC